MLLSFAFNASVGGIYCFTNEQQCEETNLLTCAPNEDSNQPAHPRSLIRVFIVCMKKFGILGYAKCAQLRC